MSTVIYPSPIFGPIHSRRLGLSLGINLLPKDGKVCTYNCIYCECGFNEDHRPAAPLPTRDEVREALKARLQAMMIEGVRPDVLTFAGNGEPTCHPKFKEIIQDTIALRDELCPLAKVSVLSNSTQIGKRSVQEALLLVDNNIQKLDTVSEEYTLLLDRPTTGAVNMQEKIELLQAFHGHVIIQTMFLKGSFQGKDVANLGDEYVNPWLRALQKIRPEEVMIYTIDRETPAHDLKKACHEELDHIAERVRKLGFLCTASY